ncbi:Transcriptional regulator, TetR family OS=Tsukamurella paurometabola (strain ATCC 8368 / DSM/ CCUG 35730 / CIP 100753 / JCM 10117 / KCTC 9821 / NBRC 16120/ NCIMB 702349 / NCTC 13040) OX=521096 GN=Tpau_0632 PE=4 SV=1 [Tsukamurella paurometabola]|uniref:Transcriptional regulator, TetR family n=1 Tax=Tsukamurella paurometabola (strain ATCC 8368 / DSM 20162 / CCUG 35730 / CIP 100753 / JCM 10117 / KCTC 9821 / NBRC 16120 / NCIMB 702349 / NCTC 13040) TaxID=521096 RepID=D5USY3_TSUPD|nr:TetR/AcrR family transcriptional regulator [Tsukamurella paurometabola]ADG77270.1 transcriptional regulator, TetR family [Tsukamurella paurometabola DSM 20162]SUP43340.1 HTH-type transcriptional repressor AcnR [Tsukamurella paurometabola]
MNNNEGMRQTTPRRGRPPSTSREEIVEHAMRLLDEHGVHGVTMKLLATEIGVSPMALYRHVDDKETLLALALDAIAEPFASMDFPDDPRERIVAAMTTVYDSLVEHPWVPEALIGPQRSGRGALHISDAAIGAAYRITGDREAALRAYRACWSLTLGTVLTHLRAKAESNEAATEWMINLLDSLPPNSAPDMRAAVQARIPPSGRDDFEASLRALLHGLFGPDQNG